MPMKYGVLRRIPRAVFLMKLFSPQSRLAAAEKGLAALVN
jgi:hypothetical protein